MSANPHESTSGEEELLQFFYQFPIGIVEIDETGAIHRLNPMASRLLMSFDRTTNLANLFWILAPFDQCVMNCVMSSDPSMTTILDNHRIAICLDERHSYINVTVLRVNASRFMVVMSDVTKLAEAEALVRAGEVRLRAVLDNAADYVYRVNLKTGEFEYVSPNIEKILGYEVGAFNETVVERSMEFVHDDDQSTLRGALVELMRAGHSQAEIRRRTKEGEYRWLSINLWLTADASGTPIYRDGNIRDVTDQKRAEAEILALNAELESRVEQRTIQLSAMLRERETLLQEIHHRVKNNLQVICSLISLQIRTLQEETSRSALKDCQSRIRTMALIHEKLYAAKDYSHIPFSNYAESLAKSIFEASCPSIGAVALDLSMEEVWLSVDKAIPCGLILNELLTNALKHAFPNARRGQVSVGLRHCDAQRIMLSVCDSGIGLGEEFKPENATSLGMELVMTLVRQLEGTLDIVRQPQTCFRVTFPQGTAP